MRRLEIKTFNEVVGTMPVKKGRRGQYKRQRIRIAVFGPNEEDETIPYIGAAVVVSFPQLVGVPNLAILFTALLKIETLGNNNLKLNRIIKLIRLQQLRDRVTRRINAERIK